MSIKLAGQFHSTLIAQYKDMIHEALLESDHKMFLDHELFEQKLNIIVASAEIDGLSKQEIINLVEEAKTDMPMHAKAG